MAAKGQEDRVVLDERKDEGSGITVRRVQVGGILIEETTDKEGHFWAVPLDDTVDYGDAGTEINLGRLSLEQQKYFHAELVHKARVPEWTAKGFVPCTKEEMNLPIFVMDGYSKPQTSLAEVADSIWMKCPLLVRKRLLAAKEREARATRNSLQPSTKQLKAMRDRGLPVGEAGADDPATTLVERKTRVEYLREPAVAQGADAVTAEE